MDSDTKRLVALINELNLIIKEIHDAFVHSKTVECEHRHVISYILMEISHYQLHSKTLAKENKLEKQVVEITKILSETQDIIADITSSCNIEQYKDSKLFDNFSKISQKMSKLG
jgi:Mg2+ and Co2+ transporter CorA